MQFSGIPLNPKPPSIKVMLSVTPLQASLTPETVLFIMKYNLLKNYENPGTKKTCSKDLNRFLKPEILLKFPRLTCRMLRVGSSVSM